MNDNRAIFAANLNELMATHNITQADIVTKLNTTASTVSDWCNGKKYPRIDSMQALADLFNVLKSDLTEDHKNKPTTKISNELMEAMERRPLLKELFLSLSKLDDDRLNAFITLADVPSHQNDE